MTPRKLEPDVVHARLRAIREMLADLTAIGVVTAEQLAGDRVTRYAVERILTAIVDRAVSVNAHVAAAVIGEGSVEYAESFRVAARAGLFPDELVLSAGLRNVLVHQIFRLTTESSPTRVREPQMATGDTFRLSQPSCRCTRVSDVRQAMRLGEPTIGPVCGN